MSELLDMINKPNDIRKIPPSDYDALAQEIREYMIDTISENGGHLASNLGVVELTMALHLVLTFPQDKLVWDVGHQSYTHKILTGRREEFRNIRKFCGISGFPKRKESSCDCFDTGHSSTSISAALGFARARDLKHEDSTVVAVIGDGALTGGVAYEGLNNLSRLKSNLIIVLNDNNMSISENVGGLTLYLNGLRMTESYRDFKKDVEKKLKSIPNVGQSMARSVKKSKDRLRRHLLPSEFGFLEDFGIKYVGPIDGHNVGEMVQFLNACRKVEGPVLLHVVTQKGRGYKPAEENPAIFHGIGCFDISTGKTTGPKNETCTSVFSRKILNMAEEHSDITAITAAMPDGTGLKPFAEKFPDRFFDVGIAEQHAVTFAAGLAAAGMRPYFAVYSSFLQRAFDQIIQDVCIQNLPVVFCIDRAGLVGADGETHHGMFDLSYLSLIPNMTVCAPKNKYELVDMLSFSYDYGKPLAIRYPRGKAADVYKDRRAPIAAGESELLEQGSDVALIAVGSMVEVAAQVHEMLLDYGIHATVINARFVKPIDEACLDRIGEDHRLVVTMEDNVIRGGFGEACSDYLHSIGSRVEVEHVGIQDTFVEHGTVDQLRRMLGMDAQSIRDRILGKLKNLQ